LRFAIVMMQTIQVSTQVVRDGERDRAAPPEPSVDDIGAAVGTLKLLADETRLRIIWNLLHGEHSVNGLADHLSMQPAAISHHLAKLRLAGAVTTRRDGNRIYYRARDDHVEALVQEALHHAEHLGPGPARHHRSGGRTA
jgi:DNA-binding transcriptional ArsR family regulator